MSPGFAARFDAALGLRLDRANPMLVRRIRQELRSKAFIGAFLTMLLIAAIAAVICAWVADSSGSDAASAGRGMFATVASVWSALMCIQAAAAQRAISNDRGAAAWDLIELTGIPPQRIILGVVQSNLVLGLLGALALAPFLVLAYLLRGIDLPTIGFALVTLPMLGAALGAVAALAGCVGAARQTRQGMGGLTALGLLGAWGGLTGLWCNSEETVSLFMAELLRGDEIAVIALLAFANCWLALLALSFASGTALLTHRALDRSTGPRLVWFGIWANAALWLVAMLGWIAYRHGGDSVARHLKEVMQAASVAGVLWALVMGVFAVSEDLEITPRQARGVAGDGPIMRRARAVIGPGSARGARATLLMTAGSLALCLPWMPDTPALFVAAYGLSVLMLSDLLARRLLARWCGTPSARRVCTLAVLAVVGLVPALVAAFAPDSNKPWLLVLSPFAGPFDLFPGAPTDSARGWLVLGIGLVACLWLAGRASTRPAGLARLTTDMTRP